MKQRKQFAALAVAAVLLLTLCACGGGDKPSSPLSNKDDGPDGKEVATWYMGGTSIFSDDVKPEDYFEGIENTLDPSAIYDSLEITADMLHGAYAINNIDDDVQEIRDTIPFEDVEFSSGTTPMTILPIAVSFGTDNISGSLTNYSYTEFEAVTDREVAVLQFVTEDKRAQCICSYEVDGRRLMFRQIKQTGEEGAPFAYEQTDLEFVYDFELCGPYLTLSKNGTSLKLAAYCLTENTDADLMMYGYSLPDSALIDELDYFSSSNMFNFAVRHDGSYYGMSAFRFTDDGVVTVYLSDTDINGEKTVFTEQYAYIMQSSSSNFLTDFGVILLDGNKAYHYTDDVTEREARNLEDQGADVDSMTEEEIKEIADKKSDLFDDLYNEFEAQGINVTINRRSGEIAMDASVLFGGDSAEITQEGKDLINSFLSAYTKIIYNEKYDGFISQTVIEGHIAPLEGSTYESGLPLSEERARNVKAYCLSTETGVDTARLSETLRSIGLSNLKPIYGTDGEVDLEACRRVSFRFVVNLEKQESEV